MHSVQTLRLKILTSKTVNREIPIYITAKGLETTTPAVEYGVTYFGCRLEAAGKLVNDFAIPCANYAEEIDNLG